MANEPDTPRNEMGEKHTGLIGKKRKRIASAEQNMREMVPKGEDEVEVKRQKEKKEKIVEENMEDIDNSSAFKMGNRKQKSGKGRSVEDLDEQGGEGMITAKKKKKKKSLEPPDEVNDNDTSTQTTNLDEEDPLTKHPTILKRFQKLLRKKTETEVTTTEAKRESTENPKPPASISQGLLPIPQPAPTKASTKSYLPLSSSLPTWQSKSNSITVSPTHSIPFTSLPLSSKLKKRLSQHLNYKEAFAVQAVVIPLLIKSPDERQDLLVSAPTGSGKTLSYILPIVHDLSTRVVTRLRAVIVVPTRELVTQVRDTVELLGSGLKVGIALGTRGLDIERTQLIQDNFGSDGSENIAVFENLRIRKDERYSSKVDILICTPGRLVEHITSTLGFTLKSLRWLVVDEADKLLAQSFQEWVGTLMNSLERSGETLSATPRANSGINKVDLRGLGIQESIYSSSKSGGDVTKVILSATMTKDAGKLSGLKFHNPKLVIVEGESHSDPLQKDSLSKEDTEALVDIPEEIFSVPSTLSEHYISIKDSIDKPLILEQLMRTKNITSGALIFTKSNENAARLARLIELLYEYDGRAINIGLISSEVDRARRKKTLAAFKRKELDLLICSDLISRGMDLSSVAHIINYDIPASPRAYVHRVGRTARAGNQGDAWSLVADNEARWFWKNIGRGIKRVSDQTVQRVNIEADETQRERYERALGRLGEEVKEQKVN